MTRNICLFDLDVISETAGSSLCAECIPQVSEYKLRSVHKAFFPVFCLPPDGNWCMVLVIDPDLGGPESPALWEHLESISA